MKKIMIMLVLLLTGCYNYQDINEIAIVNTISINKIDNYYEIAMEIVNDNKKNTLYKTNGNNIDELFNNVEEIIPNNTTYDHLKIILINNNMLDEFDNLMNYLFYNKHINDDIYLLINNNNKYINTDYLLALLKKNKITTLYNILSDYLNNAILNIPNIDKVIYVK